MAMKLNLAMLEAMAAAGASGTVILSALRPELEKLEAARQRRIPLDATRYQQRKAVNHSGPPNSTVETMKDKATLSDSPRARLFREGVGALITLNIKDSRARPLIAQWLKVANDDCQLVLATILRAQEMGAAEAPGWILETLKGKTGNGKSQSKSVGTATGVNAESGFAFGPKPALVPAGSGESAVRVLSERRSG